MGSIDCLSLVDLLWILLQPSIVLNHIDDLLGICVHGFLLQSVLLLNSIPGAHLVLHGIHLTAAVDKHNVAEQVHKSLDPVVSFHHGDALFLGIIAKVIWIFWLLIPIVELILDLFDPVGVLAERLRCGSHNEDQEVDHESDHTEHNDDDGKDEQSCQVTCVVVVAAADSRIHTNQRQMEEGHEWIQSESIEAKEYLDDIHHDGIAPEIAAPWNTIHFWHLFQICIGLLV